MVDEAVAWRNGRPKKRMGAGVLIRDGRGRVLLVEPTYKQSWELPGGSVEADESPRAACARDVKEELGLTLDVGRLLCMEWQGPEPDRTESIMFVYDGGVLDDPARITFPAEELKSFRFVEPTQIDAVLNERLSRRTNASLRALATGALAEMEHGVVLDSRGANGATLS